jgi:hypothetical protein
VLPSALYGFTLQIKLGKSLLPIVPPVLVLWAVAVLAGFAILWKYKSTPSGEETAPRRWPQASSIRARPGRATLVMFAHPSCPCTRASVAELAQLMERMRDRLQAFVLFSAEPGQSASTDLWSSAARIPGVTALRDEGGREAEHFGAMTSGVSVVYDANGALLFKGGLTPARGHEGDSFGRERILLLLNGGTADRADAPVFGCALQRSEPVRIARAANQ